METPAGTSSSEPRLRLRGKSNISSLILILAIAFLALVPPIGAVENHQDSLKSIEQRIQSSENGTTTFDPSDGLDSYLAYAALHNPGLKAAFYRWKAELEKSGVVSSLPDPMFTFGYFIEHVETRVGPQNEKFNLMQTFPWFGTLGARGAAAQEGAAVAYQRYNGEKLRLFYEVKSAYYDYFLLGREIELTRENFDLMKFWESVARAKYKVGLAQHPDVIKAQVELGKLDEKLRSLERKADPISARLRSVLNLPDCVKLPIPTSIPEAESTVDADTVLAMVLDDNPNIQAGMHTIEMQRANVSAASKASLPNFTFGLDYIATGEALNPSTPGSGIDPVMVSVGINLPIWFGKNKARKSEAVARYREAEYDLQETRNRLTSFTNETVYEYDDARRKVSLYRDGLVPKAEQSLNVSFTAYQAGEADFLSLLDAQRQLLNFQLTLDRARANAATRQAELEVITGHDFKDFSTDSTSEEK